MLGALYGSHICSRARVSTCGKQDPKDRDCREPTGKVMHPVRKDDVATCLVQIVNEPDEVTLLKVLHTSFVLLAVKSVVESIGELGCRSVER